MSDPNKTFREFRPKEEMFEVSASTAFCHACKKVTSRPWLMVNDLEYGGKVPLCTECILAGLSPLAETGVE